MLVLLIIEITSGTENTNFFLFNVVLKQMTVTVYLVNKRRTNHLGFGISRFRALRFWTWSERFEARGMAFGHLLRTEVVTTVILAACAPGFCTAFVK